ncbi:MAG: site-specific DNA-methyltransferase [Bacteroidales bacterium]|nr:site-specific DNA-methyltransferase [Bacteroidales bacterium]
MNLNTIYTGDCIELMPSLVEPNSVDMIFADPPYNLSGKKLDLVNNTTGGAYHKVNAKWDVFTATDYLEFTQQWMSLCHTALKDGGSLYISCTQHNIGEILTTGKSLGLKLNNVITWYKTNAMPNITKRTFTHSTEFVCWFVNGHNWTFNYSAVKQLNPHKTKDGQNKQMRDFLDFIELPVVQGKERIKGEDNRAAHPTQKPVRLLQIIIAASTNEGDIVLDPFFGTGTTGFVAKSMGRNWIGIEKDPHYAQIAHQRIFAQ